MLTNKIMNVNSTSVGLQCKKFNQSDFFMFEAFTTIHVTVQTCS